MTRKVDDGEVLLSVVADLVGGARISRQGVAKKTGRSLSTADRWIARIRAAFPSLKDEKDGKTTIWWLPAARRDGPTKRAVAGACVAASLAPIFAGSQHERNLRDARDYLIRAGGMQVANLDRKFFFAPRGGETALPERAGDLDAIVDALFTDSHLSFDYEHRGGTKESVRAQPLTLVIFDHQFYVVARKAGGDLYAFRFARMTDVETEDTAFAYPPKAGYDPPSVFSHQFGIHLSHDGGQVEDVRVHLRGEWAAFAMTHRWHPSQRVVSQAPGEVVLQMRVVLCPEVETWALGFGEAATVLQPINLRERVARRLRQAAQAYRKPPRLAKGGARHAPSNKQPAASSRARR